MVRNFAVIEALAAKRKGGADALQRLLSSPAPPDEIRQIPDDRWLSAMTKCVFQAGFNWKVIDDKWARFEEVFEGFDVHRWALMSDTDVDRLLATDGIVAHGPKIRSVGRNANYLAALAAANGSVGEFFADWQPEHYCRNVFALKVDAARLGGRTGQVFLRRMGVDTLVFSPDVLKVLAREGVVDGMPTSAKAFDTVQAAIDLWRAETGRPLIQISQILAFSTD